MRDLDWAYRCTRQEIIENRRALGLVQAEIRSIEALHPESNKNRHDELGFAPVHILQESLSFPSIVGHVVRPPRQDCHRFSRTRTCEMLGRPVCLSHIQEPCDNGMPSSWNLSLFSSGFIRQPYHEDGDTIVN